MGGSADAGRLRVTVIRVVVHPMSSDISCSKPDLL